MKKLLALNRSEIAIRIMRAATELGYRTVGIFSKEDRLSLHRFKADEAYLVGEQMGPVQAYLDIDGIVALAKEHSVDLIHPGYGFLSENPALARACTAAGILFVGPSAELLELLGDKRAARKIAEQANVPVVPGTIEPITSLDAATKAAVKIGFPLIVKAAFGGGGRGLRVVTDPSKLPSAVDEASREAESAFGNGAVFIERFVRRARHIEVQILGDKHGNIVHLFERDCSVQRRHQKVVELAPAPNLADDIRRALHAAAIRIAKTAGYYSAGTVEFLVDGESGEWFFIEVNPRIQVEHTVTETVTGIDIVQAQIQIAADKRLDEIGLPSQSEIPLYGHALQCRVTTEDPENGFLPDYGTINTYRSPAGFGIRLDGGTAYGGAVITPYYDSLLVKITSWGRSFEESCSRMDRALREFRIRGVKTNIYFLENVIRHEKFRTGQVTTSFLDETPELFRFPPSGDRATKVISYLGEIIVNGNPEVRGKSRPDTFREALAPQHISGAPPPGTKQLLDELGPEKFAVWARNEKRLLFTDTTFRDAHQSLFATRARTYDMLATANFVAHQLSNLFSVEMWGGATFDVCMRFLGEDPWVRLQKLRKAIPNICFQMLLRGSNAVGYSAYPPNVIRQFVAESSAQGIDIFRIFDSLNDLPNMRAAMEAVRSTKGICQGALCYTGDIFDPSRAKFSLKYYVRMAKEIERMGAHMLAIKDMAGLCKPYAAELLVRTLRDEIGLPIHFHTHDTSGIGAASVLKASEAGVDVCDGAVSSMSGTTSQPNLNSMVAALANTERATGLHLDALNVCSDYWETARTYYLPFDNAPRTGTAAVYLHEMPGGQYTNLREQAEALGLGSRWNEIAQTYADVNMAFGDIVKVTPSSKVVGDLALFLISHGMKVEQFLKLPADHSLNLPNSVIEMVSGALGQPEGGWPADIERVVLRGEPGGRKPPQPIDLAQAAETLARRLGEQPSHSDILSSLMYPEVFLKFAESRRGFGDVDVLPTPQLFYGMDKGQEIAIDLEPGKTLIVKFLTAGELHPNGERRLFFEVNGAPRTVIVTDRSAAKTQVDRRKADPSRPGEVGSPFPGLITVLEAGPGKSVKKGDRLLVMEAMKMQSTVYAPVHGKVVECLVRPGQSVEARELLFILE